MGRMGQMGKAGQVGWDGTQYAIEKENEMK
jgi:hypothetical protein